MSAVAFPEESVLRRHVATEAAYGRAEYYEMPPTDSVLRRHYEQLRQSRAWPPVEAGLMPGAEPADEAAPEAAPWRGTEHHGHPTHGGFLAWLRRLFGA